MGRAAYGGRKGDPRDIVKWWQAKTDQIEGVTEEALQAYAKTGEEAAIYIIATDKKTRASKARGGGRIDTRTMLDSVKSNVTTSSAGRKTAHFGWMGSQGKGSATMYFLYQEGGFDHFRSGQHIEGMFAMRDAGEHAINEMNRVMRQGMRST